MASVRCKGIPGNKVNAPSSTFFWDEVQYHLQFCNLISYIIQVTVPIAVHISYVISRNLLSPNWTAPLMQFKKLLATLELITNFKYPKK